MILRFPRFRSSLVRTAVAAALFLISTPVLRLTAQTAPPAAMFGAVGLQPDRGYFAQMPFEHIDMVNGNLVLSFTDLVLPGNAGMDLRLTRTYNHQRSLGRWTFGFAGVPIRLTQPEDTGGDPVWEPTLITADGASHRLVRGDAEEPDLLITPQFWRYSRSTRTLSLPNGWVATYESGNPVGGVMLVEVHDAYGNAITPDWEGGAPGDIRPLRLEAVTQKVGDASLPTRSRTVTFSYSSAFYSHVPSTMTYEGRTWTYEQDYVVSGTSDELITRVSPPIGPAWQFSYAFSGLGGSLTVSTPHGGTVTLRAC